MLVWRVTNHILDIRCLKTGYCIFRTRPCFRIRSNHAHKWLATSFATNYFTIKLAIFNRWNRSNPEIVVRVCSTPRPVVNFRYASSARWVIGLFTSRSCIKHNTAFPSACPSVSKYWLSVNWTFVIRGKQLYKWLSLPVLN